ncbi:cobalt-precorrin 5A hydrolase [Tropicibacter naphthalenivorans]|uniref:Cobalamin biosynthesis protein CbiG n=2 Tax=Tropicibacter naphthalenivorans TaxID=441103 RepID=A0A0P1H1N1_9RHOB|nr:cobalamin biosynthesis protein [Tropicibacter naphthalenivorans]CUH80819.1 cobalamin biosynthesis protein CbiG [Tropicibacter naphthalenivorans]SMC90374.1 cobalt-precorrin 5A hydrolase [Tropicibacter naphthalenivorans]
MIVAGFGFRKAAGVDSLRDALRRAGQTHAPTHLATAAEKASSAVFQSLAQTLDLPTVAVSQDALQAIETQTHSVAAEARFATGSVAEAAALAAAGPGARLLTPRQISTDRMATCAIAIGETP